MNMIGMNIATSSTASMNMAASATSAAAAAVTSRAMDMGSMSMGGNSCKISMLWNWDTIDTCFLAESWHNTSRGMFAGSCIGVICLVITLEFLRRSGKSYDRYIFRQFQQQMNGSEEIMSRSSVSGCNPDVGHAYKTAASSPTLQPAVTRAGTVHQFRPNLPQQAIRALLHMLQFAVAYFIMLLAMYFNGYIIICIFIGAYIGSFVFGWETVTLVGPKEEVTVCCG